MFHVLCINLILSVNNVDININRVLYLAVTIYLNIG